MAVKMIHFINCPAEIHYNKHLSCLINFTLVCVMLKRRVSIFSRKWTVPFLGRHHLMDHCGLFWTSQAIRGALMWCGVFALLFTSYRNSYTKNYSQNLKPEALIYCKTPWQALRLQIVSVWCGCLCTLSEKWWLPAFVPRAILFHGNYILVRLWG